MKLYVLPGACSLASHIVVEYLTELSGTASPGIEVTVLKRGQERQPDYLRVNPRGNVPTLIGATPFPISESIAVLLHLADGAPSTNLLPRLGDPRRDWMITMLAYLVSSFHPGFQMLWRSERFADTDEGCAAVRRSAEARLIRFFAQLDRDIGSWPAFKPDAMTILDAYLFVMGRWGLRLESPANQLPTLWRRVEQICEVPATQRAMKAEGISLIEPRQGIG
jgi:glutathione S-transferase